VPSSYPATQKVGKQNDAQRTKTLLVRCDGKLCGSHWMPWRELIWCLVSSLSWHG